MSDGRALRISDCRRSGAPSSVLYLTFDLQDGPILGKQDEFGAAPAGRCRSTRRSDRDQRAGFSHSIIRNHARACSGDLRRIAALRHRLVEVPQDQSLPQQETHGERERPVPVVDADAVPLRPFRPLLQVAVDPEAPVAVGILGPAAGGREAVELAIRRVPPGASIRPSRGSPRECQGCRSASGSSPRDRRPRRRRARPRRGPGGRCRRIAVAGPAQQGVGRVDPDAGDPEFLHPAAEAALAAADIERPAKAPSPEAVEHRGIEHAGAAEITRLAISAIQAAADSFQPSLIVCLADSPTAEVRMPWLRGPWPG